MTQSPWADNPITEAYPKTSRSDDGYNPVLSLINQIQRIHTWGNSEVNDYLFDLMDNFPDIEVQKHLFSSYNLRAIHYSSLDTTKDILRNKLSLDDIIKTLFDNVAYGVSNLNQTKEDLKKSIEVIWSTHKKQSQSETNDALYALSVYSACIEHCAQALEKRENSYGYIHPSMPRLLAEKIDRIISRIEGGDDINTAQEPAELSERDNFVQNAHRSLSAHLTSNLSSVQKICQDPKALASINPDFTTAVFDAKAIQDFSLALHDGLNEILASHEWPENFESVALDQLRNSQDGTLPKMSETDGIQQFIVNFIEQNQTAEIHPDDARILVAVLDSTAKAPILSPLILQ